MVPHDRVRNGEFSPWLRIHRDQHTSGISTINRYGTQEEAMSNLQQLVNIHYAGINAGDLDAAMSVFDEDIDVVTPNGPMKGVKEHRKLGEAFQMAAPDATIEALRVFESGDTIVVEGR